MGARMVDEETIRRWIADGIANNPSPGGSSYFVYKALISARLPEASIISGSLIKGEWYKILNAVAGDDFDNVANYSVGGSSATNSVFMATGTTPTDWSNGSELSSYGCPFLVSTDSDGEVAPLTNTIEGTILFLRGSEGNYQIIKNVDGNDLTGITPDNPSSYYSKLVEAFPYYKTYPSCNLNATEGYNSENFARLSAEITDVNAANKILILEVVATVNPFARNDGFNNLGVSIEVYP